MFVLLLFQKISLPKKWSCSFFKFAFMGKFLQLHRFVPTTTSTTTLDQPTLLYDLNPQPGQASPAAQVEGGWGPGWGWGWGRGWGRLRPSLEGTPRSSCLNLCSGKVSLRSNHRAAMAPTLLKTQAGRNLSLLVKRSARREGWLRSRRQRLSRRPSGSRGLWSSPAVCLLSQVCLSPLKALRN